MILADAHATEAVGAALASVLQPGDVIGLSGSLGAGKTCLARGLIRALGHVGDVPSPSFALVIPYEAPLLRLPVWHVDLYRLDDPEQAAELGLEDVLADGVLLIEWPERMDLSDWAPALQLRIEPDDQGRRLTASVPPPWKDRWPFP